MNYLSFLLAVVAGIAGLYVGNLGFRGHTNITRTAEKISGSQIIKPAVQHGIASSLIFFAIINSASLFEPEYVWSLKGFASAVFVSLIPGVIVTVGAVYQIYTTALFRDKLIRKYRKNDKS